MNEFCFELLGAFMMFKVYASLSMLPRLCTHTFLMYVPHDSWL